MGTRSDSNSSFDRPGGSDQGKGAHTERKRVSRSLRAKVVQPGFETTGPGVHLQVKLYSASLTGLKCQRRYEPECQTWD